MIIILKIIKHFSLLNGTGNFKAITCHSQGVSSSIPLELQEKGRRDTLRTRLIRCHGIHYLYFTWEVMPSLAGIVCNEKQKKKQTAFSERCVALVCFLSIVNIFWKYDVTYISSA